MITFAAVQQVFSSQLYPGRTPARASMSTAGREMGGRTAGTTAGGTAARRQLQRERRAGAASHRESAV